MDSSSGNADLFQGYFHNTDAFDAIEISISGGGFAIDNLTLDAPASVPEPSTILLFGAGLLAAVGIRRKRQS